MLFKFVDNALKLEEEPAKEVDGIVLDVAGTEVTEGIDECSENNG